MIPKPVLDAVWHVLGWITTQLLFLTALSGFGRRFVFAIAAGWLASLVIDIFRRASLWTMVPVLLLWAGVFLAFGIAGIEFWPAKATYGAELHRYAFITSFLATTPIPLATLLMSMRRRGGKEI